MAIGRLSRSFGEGAPLGTFLGRVPRDKTGWADLFDRLAQSGIETITVDGRNGLVEGPVADRTIMLRYAKNRCWATEIVGVADRALAGGGSYVDLGANIGLTVLPFVGRDDLTIHAVEAHPGLFELLARNVARNVAGGRAADPPAPLAASLAAPLPTSIRLRHAAVAAVNGTAILELADTNLGDNRLRAASGGTDGRYGEARRDTITVPAHRLDSLLDAARLPRPLVIKSDLQGAEPFVLSGGEAVLGRCDVWILEYWPYGLRRLGHDPADFVRALCDRFPWGALLADGDDPAAVGLRPLAGIVPSIEAVTADREIAAADIVVARTPDALDVV